MECSWSTLSFFPPMRKNTRLLRGGCSARSQNTNLADERYEINSARTSYPSRTPLQVPHGDRQLPTFQSTSATTIGHMPLMSSFVSGSLKYTLYGIKYFIGKLCPLPFGRYGKVQRLVLNRRLFSVKVLKRTSLDSCDVPLGQSCGI